MDVFQFYSQYYDLLYKDKDYKAEIEYIDSIINIHDRPVSTILELGCGTGKHASLLVSKGYQVLGIDQSNAMLEDANKRKYNLPTDIQKNLNFLQGDICNVLLDMHFDVILSLFHVISYQTTNDSLSELFSTVSKHLKKGGLFIFDCWYGPAVLSVTPDVRIKRMDNENIEVTRLAEPKLKYNENIVEVHYDVMMKDKSTNKVTSVSEIHKMRYLFNPEIELFAKNEHFIIKDCHEFLSKHQPSNKTWGVCYILEKI